MDNSHDFDAAGIAGKRHTRGEARNSLFLAATAHRANGADIVLRVRNLSAGGLMGETSEPFSTGEALDIDLRGVGRVAARVAWTAPQRIGVAFLLPVDPRLARKTSEGGDGDADLIEPSAGIRRAGLQFDLD